MKQILFTIFLLIASPIWAQIEFPDNVIETNCNHPLDESPWNIRLLGSSLENDVASYSPIIVGDIDGNGVTDIVTAKYNGNNLGQFIGRFSVDTDLEGIVVPCSLAGKAAGMYLVTVINHYDMITKKVIKKTPSSYGFYNWEW